MPVVCHSYDSLVHSAARWSRSMVTLSPVLLIPLYTEKTTLTKSRLSYPTAKSLPGLLDRLRNLLRYISILDPTDSQNHLHFTKKITDKWLLCFTFGNGLCHEFHS